MLTIFRPFVEYDLFGAGGREDVERRDAAHDVRVEVGGEIERDVRDAGLSGAGVAVRIARVGGGEDGGDRLCDGGGCQDERQGGG
jgi:hypothetical protein